MYGVIIGDIVGSKFEFDRGNKSRDFEFFAPGDMFTDDTVMTCAVAEALMAAGADASEGKFKAYLIDAMKRWGQAYPNAGYGARFGEWVRSSDPKPYGSYGNGSAMRVAPVGWAFDRLSRTLEVAKWSAEVTHNHPEGIKGAQATAACVYLARTGASRGEIRSFVVSNYGYDLSRTLDEIRATYHHVESCQETVPEAITCFLEADDFESAIRNDAYIGGDVDTLGAITGGIASAYFGVPSELVNQAKRYLDGDVLDVVSAFETHFSL